MVFVKGSTLTSPFSIYIDDLITDFKLSGCGADIGNIFAGVSYTLMTLYFCLRLVVVCKNLSLHVNNMVVGFEI